MFSAQKYEKPEYKEKLKQFSKLSVFRDSLQEVFCKKSVSETFAKFTEKRLCQSLYFNKVAG